MSNIVIIESDNDSLILMKEILEENKFNVFSTTHLEHAFDVMKRGIKVDLILLSLVLKNVERFDVIEKLKSDEISSGVPIIAVASSAQTSEKARALKEGCVSVVSKPIDEAELVEAIKKVL